VGNFHGRMMNIQMKRHPSEDSEDGPAQDRDYKEGHREARHAAAEIANEADRQIAEFRQEVKRLEGIIIELAECHAANAECPPKSTPKYTLKRFKSILERVIPLLKGEQYPSHWNLVTPVEKTIERCEQAMGDLPV